MMNMQCICDKVCDLKVPGVREACISQVRKKFVSQVLRAFTCISQVCKEFVSQILRAFTPAPKVLSSIFLNIAYIKINYIV